MRRLIVALLAVALAACSSPSQSATPGAPSGSAATAGATAGSSPEPSAAAGSSASPVASFATSTQHPPVEAQVLLPGAAVEVAVRELNIRRNPSTASKKLATLRRGAVLIISPIDNHALGWGPVQADGYTWYPVVRPNVFDSDLHLDPLPKPPIEPGGTELAGWVASDDGSQAYLVPIAPRCPTTVDLLNVSGMLPAERLACFGEPIVLEGTYGCSGCGGLSLGTYKPVWLAVPFEFDFLSVNPADQLGPLALRFAPDGPPRPAIGSILRVTVHVDDPRSTKCTMSEPDGVGGTVTIDVRTAMLFCRERLVVDTYEVLGVDPSFPPG